MTVTLHDATLDDKLVLCRLMQLYLHDFSEFDGADLGERGLFGYVYLDRYWTDADRFAFLLRVDGRLAGFVLVNGHTNTDEGEHAVAEFFVVRKYRRRGVGRRAAVALFERFPGVWEVPIRAANATAHAFWRAVIEAMVGTTYDLVECQAWPGRRGPARSSGSPLSRAGSITPVLASGVAWAVGDSLAASSRLGA